MAIKSMVNRFYKCTVILNQLHREDYQIKLINQWFAIPIFKGKIIRTYLCIHYQFLLKTLFFELHACLQIVIVYMYIDIVTAYIERGLGQV